MSEITKTTEKVFCQGWKVVDVDGNDVRGDGYSYHLTEHDIPIYSKKRLEEERPEDIDGYRQLDGKPYIRDVDISIYRQLVKAKEQYGIWYPGINGGCPCQGYNHMPSRTDS